MTLDQVSKIVGIIRDGFIILLVTFVIGSAVLIRHRINEYFENLSQETIQTS